MRYARLLFSEFAAKVPLWLTINEQNTMILHPGAIGVPADRELPDKKALYQQNHHMMLAQAQIFALCHREFPWLRIGPAINTTSMYAESCKPEDAIAAHNWRRCAAGAFWMLRCMGATTPGVGYMRIAALRRRCSRKMR